MDLVVRHGEREERVQVRRNGEGYEVAVGDRTYHIDAEAARAGLHSLRIDGAQHEVAVRAQAEGAWWVSTVQGGGAVAVSDPLTHLASQTRGGKEGRRRERVTAYMPGRVVTRHSLCGRKSGFPRRSLAPFADGSPNSSPQGEGPAP